MLKTNGSATAPARGEDPITVDDCLALAASHWASGKGGRVLTIGATRAASCGALGPLAAAMVASTPSHGVRVLQGLQEAGLGAKSVADYYGALRRALTLSGFPTPLWPKPPTIPRRTREPITHEDLARLIHWLDSWRSKGDIREGEYQATAHPGYASTADLARFLRATGARVNVEVLQEASIGVSLNAGSSYDVLHIRGKGGHERRIPVVDLDGRALLRSDERMAAMRAVPYHTHLWRWKQAVRALGITSRLPTPHSVRHLYATSALETVGGNIKVVQDLLGHADPGTTARYLKTDLDGLARALTSGAGGSRA